MKRDSGRIRSHGCHTSATSGPSRPRRPPLIDVRMCGTVIPRRHRRPPTSRTQTPRDRHSQPAKAIGPTPRNETAVGSGRTDATPSMHHSKPRDTDRRRSTAAHAVTTPSADTVACQPVGHRRRLTDTHGLRVTALPTQAALHHVSTVASTRSARPNVQWHGMRLEGQGKQTLGGCHVAV